MNGRKKGPDSLRSRSRSRSDDRPSPQESGVAGPPVWFRFPVSELLAELQRQGFGIGIDTSATTITVITKAIEAGDEARLDLWLCPVLARSPEQQAVFREVYKRFFIPALDAPDEEDGKPGKRKGGDEEVPASHDPTKIPEQSSENVPAVAIQSRRKVVASLKSRTSGAYVLDRFVRSAEMASDPVMLRVVRQLRFTHESGRSDFDVRKTLHRAVRSAGFATPVFSSRRQHVEYLMLIDRHNDRDHRAHLHNSLYETLKENNIFVERFWFDNSPLICRNDHYPGGITIGELLSLFGHAVLLLFADGLQFIDTFRLELFPWASVFRHWPHRYFISSVPPVLWGRREVLLRDLFPALLPLSTEALRMLADDLDENDGSESDRLLYRQEGADYSLVPVRIEGKRLDEIASFFSRPMQRWIAACAVYPELNWNLTLFLGELLSTKSNSNEPLNSWRNVGQLLRLEWFVKGRIPDTFRLQLIDSWLTRKEVSEICGFLHEQLASAPPLPGEPGYEGSSLQLAVYDLLGEENPEQKQMKSERLHELLEQERLLPDIVTLHYANTDTISPLDFEIPEHLLKQLGVDVEALKRESMPPLPENFVPIKGGTFMMGSPESEADRSSNELQHEVKVSDFAMCRYAVSVGDFKLFMKESGYLTDAEKENWSYVWNGKEWGKKEGVNWRHDVAGNERAETEYNHPVLHVSWNDAVAYCVWLSKKQGIGTFRLPTEAEWEYACRAIDQALLTIEGIPVTIDGDPNSFGTTSTPFNTGENLTTDQANYDGNYPYRNYPKGEYRQKTVPVDAFKPNGYGLYNMHGNVWEWCSDWYDEKYYDECKKSGVEENPQGPDKGSSRVLRGGSWINNARYCRSASRSNDNPGLRYYYVGFRLVFVPQFSAAHPAKKE
jgi:formylglycine-generating enzyme required for sulfatase activity